ncbi:MAG: glycosyltransferase family 4 protein [Phycisphaerae bacterium]|nr:glycosyltransferase family 4 protein [Phycisphaerae bacterium]
MKSLIVEGWRQIAHSYAIVSQNYLLELRRRGDIALYHRDVPFASPAWKRVAGLFGPERDAAIMAVPPPPAGLRADAVLRAGFPHFFRADTTAARTVVWGTSEFGIIEPSAIGDRIPPREALSAATARIVACSTWAASGFINSGASPANVAVVPCGIDTSIFFPPTPEQRAALRKQFGWEGKFVILNISAMTRNKGVNLLLQTVAALAPKHPNLLVVLKGSDTLYNSSRFAQTNFSMLTPEQAALVGPRIGYSGDALSEARMAALYQAADAYVSPYRAEGFNLPVLEAAACGLPVVCTRGGSTDDFTDDAFALRVDASTSVDNEGRTWREPSLPMLIDQVERTIADASFRAAAAAAGPAWARERFTWARSVDRLLPHLFP